jgi:hypothetical protein
VLHKSQRGLGFNELSKYCAVRDTPDEQRVFEQAVFAMIDAGSIASYMHPGAGLRYHFPEMVAELAAKAAPDDDQVEETEEAEQPDASKKIAVLDGFETALNDAWSAIQLALEAQAPDWSTVPADRREPLHRLMRDVFNDTDRLCNRMVETGVALNSSDPALPATSEQEEVSV